MTCGTGWKKSLAAEYQNGGKYIRPIALFQAQPKGKEDATTFEKLRTELVNTGIPAEHIAIRTADVNELKNVDLLSPDCPVRYIITVNALKEGWDCPFAYILASLANKTSQVDVEQILGRILRLPYTAERRAKSLNMSYVLTSSNDFDDTVQQIIRGLNSAGFSDRDDRLAEPVEPVKPASVPEQLPIIEPEAPQEDFAELDGKSIGAELQRRRRKFAGIRPKSGQYACRGPAGGRRIQSGGAGRRQRPICRRSAVGGARQGEYIPYDSPVSGERG